MPSSLHELILALIRRNPALLREWAAEALGPVWPADATAQPADPQMVSLAPIERRADLVLELPSLSAVVEAQLRVDNDKPAAWPVYQALLHARSGRPVAVVVITTKASAEKWARAGVTLGPAQTWRPNVIGPAPSPSPQPGPRRCGTPSWRS